MGFFKGTSIWETKIAGNTYILCEQKLFTVESINGGQND